MTTSNMNLQTPKQPPRLLYPSLVVAAIAVTLFSALGIAGITGHLPGAFAQVAARQAGDKDGAPGPLAAATCAECGVVESVHAIETKGSGSGVGAVLGGVGGAVLGNMIGAGNGRTAMTLIGGGAGAYAGNEIEKNGKRHVVWQTRVRMDNGTVRTITTRYQPEFGAGSKVKVVDGQLVARG
ncbi:MAG TPA: glycine zipper 2TM domain-containing protein [Rhodocyclaceae bacterium]